VLRFRLQSQQQCLPQVPLNLMGLDFYQLQYPKTPKPLIKENYIFKNNYGIKIKLRLEREYFYKKEEKCLMN